MYGKVLHFTHNLVMLHNTAEEDTHTYTHLTCATVETRQRPLQ